MGVQYSVTPKVASDPGEVRLTIVAGGLGGLIGVRVVIDTSAMPSQQEVLHALDKVQQNLPMHEWPTAAPALNTLETEDGYTLTTEDGWAFILE